MIAFVDALDLIAQHAVALETETVSLADCVGRVLAQDVSADVDSPPHDKSVMDGFAVRSSDIAEGALLRVIATVVAGDPPGIKLSTGTAARIMTGAPLPLHADAVVMVEQAKISEVDGEERVRFDLNSIDVGKHTMPRASSFAKGERIFGRQHRIRPLDVGLLAEVGCQAVVVYRQATVSLLPTGNELVDPGQRPDPGQIRNSNGPMLLALLKDAGCEVRDLGIGRDDPEDLAARIERGLDTDCLILTGGVSAGILDLVPPLLQAAGVRPVFHKVKIKPGKPIWFGVRDRDGGGRTLVFGLPGNPVSSLVGFQLFVQAALARMHGATDGCPHLLRAELAISHEIRGDRPTWWPGFQESSESICRRVRPLGWQGSSDLRALGKADSLIYFPADRAVYQSGEAISFLPIG